MPWSAVRLLRLRRLGDVGALDDAWAGWVVNRNGLFSPDGRRFRPEDMRHWWSQIDRARLWQEAYERGDIRGVGRSPATTLQPAAGMAAQPADAAPAGPIEAAVTLTAFAGPPRQAAGASRAGMAGSLSIGAARSKGAAAARSAAGLVILSTSGTRFAQKLMLQGFPRIAHGR